MKKLTCQHNICKPKFFGSFKPKAEVPPFKPRSELQMEIIINRMNVLARKKQLNDWAELHDYILPTWQRLKYFAEYGLNYLQEKKLQSKLQ